MFYASQPSDTLPRPRSAKRPSCDQGSLKREGAVRSQEGRREDRVRAAPAVSCAKMHIEKRTRAYRFSGSSPAFPAQWFYSLFRALPGETRACLSPSPARSVSFLANLTPAIGASGPHDFAVRVSRARQSQLSRPSHPRPAFRDECAYAPLVGRDAQEVKVICLRDQAADRCDTLARRANQQNAVKIYLRA